MTNTDPQVRRRAGEAAKAAADAIHTYIAARMEASGIDTAKGPLEGVALFLSMQSKVDFAEADRLEQEATE
ncbi:hypothetical protein [Corynebacterium pygosceleis]|uniref:hypothetical protein n=1 Tax=Corynebacterium pygosceleis TaxID=2800406 RepID=UPI002005E5A7|nr:hypothetical protein [Corynebacterium pygosceleis]MCK7676411.1 hypothetical protein [Corynebacterium pygosceleis]